MREKTIKTIQGGYLSLWLFETIDWRGRKQNEVWVILPLGNKRTETDLASIQKINTALPSMRKLKRVIHAPVRSGPGSEKPRKTCTCPAQMV